MTITHRRHLLAPLQQLVRRLEDDIRERIGEDEALAALVAAEHRQAKDAGRTGVAEAAFRDEMVTQAAVAWVLAAVFVRFLEDNGLLDRTRWGNEERVRWIAGDRLALVDLARDAERDHFRAHPAHGEREYLEHVFARVAALPGMDRVLDRRHNPLWRLGPTADGARDLLDTFRQRDPDSGAAALTFAAGDPPADPEHVPNGATRLDTRFLGDLYQDLSEAARKRYALLQTPDFVEAFLLDRSLEPAIERFGADAVRLIDPACGSGHFLLGAFARLVDRHQRAAPADNPRVVAQALLGDTGRRPRPLTLAGRRPAARLRPLPGHPPRARRHGHAARHQPPRPPPARDAARRPCLARRRGRAHRARGPAEERDPLVDLRRPARQRHPPRQPPRDRDRAAPLRQLRHHAPDTRRKSPQKAPRQRTDRSRAAICSRRRRARPRAAQARRCSAAGGSPEGDRCALDGRRCCIILPAGTPTFRDP